MLSAHDWHFLNFNFSEVYDPFLRPGRGPNSSWLYQLAYLARQGDSGYVWEFSDVMQWTLKKLSYESFQQAHGIRPITWEEWYLEKLRQFLTTFLFGELLEDQMPLPGGWDKLSKLGRNGMPDQSKIGEISGTQPEIGWDELLEAFPAEVAEEQDWHDLLWRLHQAGERRVEALRRIVANRINTRERQTQPAPQPDRPRKSRRRRSPNELRNQIILTALEEGKSREQICELLDRKAIETLPSMRELRVTSWVEAWEDRELRQSIQEMITRTIERHGAA